MALYNNGLRRYVNDVSIFADNTVYERREMQRFTSCLKLHNVIK